MLLLRCDAGPDIGSGHFFRQLALAECARERGRDAEIAIHEPADGLRQQAEHLDVEILEIPEEPGSAEDAARLVERARHREATAIVVDGYHFSPDYYRQIDGPWTVAAVDDLADQSFPVDVLLNQNIDAEHLNYDTPDRTTRLLGLDYVLMRRQFREKRRTIEQRDGPDVPERIERVFVFMGGADPTDQTAKVLHSLQSTEFDGRLNVVVGDDNPHRESIRRAGDGLDAEIRYHENIARMADLMQGHHFSINAGGSTSWELACLGVPMMQIVVAENQRNIADGLELRNVSTCLGWHEEVSTVRIADVFQTLANAPVRRREQIEGGMELVDGRGAPRVLDNLLA